jgi:hypothetical protein
VFEEKNSDEMLFEAMQIHAVCADAGIEDAKTRVLTYIHFKLKENNNDATYFEWGSEQDCASIEIMLGDRKTLDGMKNNSEKKAVRTSALIMDHCAGTARNIRKLDAVFRNNFGMENRLSSELRNRLRLYRDRAFRNEMLRLYEEIVIPRKDLYEMCTIKRAFRQVREKKAVREAEDLL